MGLAVVRDPEVIRQAVEPAVGTPSIPRAVIQRTLSADLVGLAEFYGAIAIITSPASLGKYSDAVIEPHAAGLGLLLYTLKSEDGWREARAFGADGIVTDMSPELDSWVTGTVTAVAR